MSLKAGRRGVRSKHVDIFGNLNESAIDELLEPIEEDIEDLDERLDTAEGKITTLENEMAVVKERVIVTESDEGNPLEITTSLAQNLSACTVTIVAEQDGTPTPDSPVEITGLSEVVVRSSGKNLCALAVVPSGHKYQYQSCLVCDAELESNTTYTVSFVTQEGFTYYINENFGVGQNFTGTGERQSVTFTTKSLSKSTSSQYDSTNTGWIVFKNSTTQSDVPTFTDVQIEKGSSVTEYEAYNGRDYTFSIGSTCYGGELNTKSGVLTVTHANIASYDGESINEPWLSSIDEYESGTTPTEGAQVVYPLTEATTTSLTAAEIALISGTNTLTTNAEEISATYNVTIGDILDRED